MPTQVQDEKILELYNTRDESAISETAARYGAYCGSIAMNILHNREDADEVVNDVYLKTWNAIPPEQPRVFSTFIGRIARNLSLDFYEKRNAAKRGGGNSAVLLGELESCIPSLETVEAQVDSRSLATTIDDFLATLGQESRLFFVRRYWHCDTVPKIAARFDVGESKVKVSLMRTREKLKSYLEKEGYSI